jgi:hypothetical protein
MIDATLFPFPDPEGRKPGKSYLADDLDFHHCSRSDVLEICGNALEEISFILYAFNWPHELVDQSVRALIDQSVRALKRARDVHRLIAEAAETDWSEGEGDR